MPLLIAVLLGLSGLIVVIYPLLGLERAASNTYADGPIAEVAERERSARDALREVEFDHRLGNLDDADYQALRARYERRALAALKTRYQREQELDALIERQLDALRAQQTTGSGSDGDASRVTQTQRTSGSASAHRAQALPHSSARPVNGPQARRRRGGRI
ncbi:MAG: hypothetical protein ACM3N4_04250 [Nitrososphaerota archaeon]